MYPPEIVAPMKQDLVSAGFEELLSVDDVNKVLGSEEGSVLLVINSVCGCAAGNARPAVKAAVQHIKKPDQLLTVFAGVDKEAVEKAREFTLPYPPSSPSMALFKDGKLVHFIERHQIEGNTSQILTDHLVKVFDHYC